MNSWAMHYFVVQPGLGLFLQFPWAGAYHDVDKCREVIQKGWLWAENVQKMVSRCLDQDAIPDGVKLVVVSSDFIQSRWIWLPAPESRESTELDWHLTGSIGVLNDATASLGDVLNGKTKQK